MCGYTPCVDPLSQSAPPLSLSLSLSLSFSLSFSLSLSLSPSLPLSLPPSPSLFTPLSRSPSDSLSLFSVLPPFWNGKMRKGRGDEEVFRTDWRGGDEEREGKERRDDEEE